jgi:hypothetical protein
VPRLTMAAGSDGVRARLSLHRSVEISPTEVSQWQQMGQRVNGDRASGHCQFIGLGPTKKTKSMPGDVPSMTRMICG